MNKVKQVFRELLKLDFRAAGKTLLCKCNCWSRVQLVAAVIGVGAQES